MNVLKDLPLDKMERHLDSVCLELFKDKVSPAFEKIKDEMFDSKTPFELLRGMEKEKDFCQKIYSECWRISSKIVGVGDLGRINGIYAFYEGKEKFLSSMKNDISVINKFNLLTQEEILGIMKGSGGEVILV